MNIFEDLKFRGLLYQITDEETLKDKLANSSMTLYIGFDPTADSLHIGSLLPILTLKRYQLAGHHPIALVGGGTGLIGDPSGKNAERQLNTQEIVHNWSECVKNQLSQFLEFDNCPNPAKVVNNYDWLSKLDVMQFLRDIGKHFSIGYMLAKDSVKSRLEVGISYTEFTYMILQAYDFYQLYNQYNCELQVGGSDQWGNITAGTELIRRISRGQGYGITQPLVTKADGTKFGKTESGTIWLDPVKTSPYEFYQFWLNTEDDNVINYLKYFTFLDHETILELESSVLNEPQKREAQRKLASEVTELVHSKEAVLRAEKISKSLFYGNLKELKADEIKDGFSDAPSFKIESNSDLNFLDLIVESGLVNSKGQAKRDVKSGAIYINGDRCQQLDRVLDSGDCIDNEFIILRKGKKNYLLVHWPH